MQTHKLGRTGLDVGVISMGSGDAQRLSRETVVALVREAVARGVNYFDLCEPYPNSRDNFGGALDGLRDEVLITGHLGSTLREGQYCRSRDANECAAFFHDQLARLHTGRVDVLFLHNCDEADDYEHLVRPGGLLELARRLQGEGKARFVGFSGHKAPVALKAVRSGEIDVLMYPIKMSGHAVPGQQELFHACAAEGVGLVGMKPYGGGELLQPGAEPAVTPVQCLSYALSQPGVSTLVPGVKGVEELHAALHYLDATDEERDFSAALSAFEGCERGVCTYCNHCLPCPVGIDIGLTIRLLVTAQLGGADAQRLNYEGLRASASACVECGECTERCPFGVDVVPKMREGARFAAGR